jgi:hypothetical protein
MRIDGYNGRLFAPRVLADSAKEPQVSAAEGGGTNRGQKSAHEDVHENPRHDHLAPLTRRVRLSAGHCLLAIARIQAPVWYVFGTPNGLNYRASCVTAYIGLRKVSLR